jgi:hypothetical protein
LNCRSTVAPALACDAICMLAGPVMFSWVVAEADTETEPVPMNDPSVLLDETVVTAVLALARAMIVPDVPASSVVPSYDPSAAAAKASTGSATGTPPVELSTDTLPNCNIATVDGADSRLSTDTLVDTSAVKPTLMLSSVPSDGSNWSNGSVCCQSVAVSATV